MKKILLFIAVVLAACQTEKRVLNTWLGHTKHELLLKWGPPARSTNDGNGGEILVFTKQGYVPGGIDSFYTPGVVSTTYNPSVTYYDYTFFYVNGAGKIYHWMKRQENVPPQQIDLTLFVR